MANIIYLDQPAGTGFSYSRNPLADIPSDLRSAKLVNEFVHNVKRKLKLFQVFFLMILCIDLWRFFLSSLVVVVQWLAKHPEYYSNPFYVTGNSYSGIVVPAIVQEISNGKFLIPHFNLYANPFPLTLVS